MQRGTFIAAIAALALLAVIRVASTHRVFSATLDEPIHLASGYEWFDGAYRGDVTHPPLSRILFALPLRLAGVPPPAEPANMIDRGNQILYAGDRYERNLALARMGNLVLLLVAIVAVALWARRAFGDAVAIVAVAIFTNVPAILGHAGLMTTDLSVAATLPLALLALSCVIPSVSRGTRAGGAQQLMPAAAPAQVPRSARDDMRFALFLGLAIGLGVLSKLSFLVYFPLCALVMIAMRWPPRVKLRAIAIAAGIALLIVTAGYRFEIRRPVDIASDAPQFFEAAHIPRALAYVPLPAPSLPIGFAQVRLHDRGGHTAFLLGKQSRTGWWYYFPVVFFFKTPIPLLILFAIGAAYRRTREFTLIAAAILLFAMTASLNIGLRHILPIYAPVSIVAAFAVVEGGRLARHRVVVIALLAWLFIGVAVEHPDYLAWFNEAAGRNPAHVAVDSNLDWGQDMLRLARVVRDRRIDHLWIVMNNNTRLDRHGIAAEWLPPRTKVSGWIAAGENWTAFTDEYDWLKAYQPVQRVGKSIRLYHIP